MLEPEENMVNAGILFMFSAWLQSQMVDLIIAANHPELIEDFVASPERVPQPFSKLRASYWEKDFGHVKSEFLTVFSSSLTSEEAEDIEHIYYLRNMIAHAHVSIGRKYMLYRPSGDRKEQAIIEALKPKPVEGRSNPLMFKLEFWRNEKFVPLSDLMERTDQQCFSRLARQVGIPHGRIR